jgi:hypothetical protein
VARATEADTDEINVSDREIRVHETQLLLHERSIILRNPPLDHAQDGPARARIGAGEEVQQVLSHDS